MGLREGGFTVRDEVTAQLVEVVPDPEPPPAPEPPAPPETTPVEDAMEATEAHTGADPPPEG